MQGLVARGLTLEEIWDVDVKTKLCRSHCSQNIGQGHQVRVCAVSTLRRSTLQGLMVVGLIVEEISNIDAKYVKVTGVQNIGQGHRVKVPAKSVHLEEALCKVW